MPLHRQLDSPARFTVVRASTAVGGRRTPPAGIKAAGARRLIRTPRSGRTVILAGTDRPVTCRAGTCTTGAEARGDRTPSGTISECSAQRQRGPGLPRHSRPLTNTSTSGSGRAPAKEASRRVDSGCAPRPEQIVPAPGETPSGTSTSPGRVERDELAVAASARDPSRREAARRTGADPRGGYQHHAVGGEHLDVHSVPRVRAAGSHWPTTGPVAGVKNLAPRPIGRASSSPGGAGGGEGEVAVVAAAGGRALDPQAAGRRSAASAAVAVRPSRIVLPATGRARGRSRDSRTGGDTSSSNPAPVPRHTIVATRARMRWQRYQHKPVQAAS